jgi:hypothetical protein
MPILCKSASGVRSVLESWVSCTSKETAGKLMHGIPVYKTHLRQPPKVKSNVISEREVTGAVKKSQRKAVPVCI